MKKSLAMICGLSALMLTGCASAPTNTVQNYVLPTNAQSVVHHAESNLPLIVVQPVLLSPLLSGNGLVYQTSPTQVVQAQHHVWAESLSVQLTQQITQQLRTKQRRYWATDLASQLVQTDGARLTIKFTQFNGSYTGNADIRGEWIWSNAEGKVRSVHPFAYTVPLQKDGYTALVNALAQGVERLTTQIAAKVG